MRTQHGEKISAWIGIGDDHRLVAAGKWEAKFPTSISSFRPTILHAAVDVAPLVEAVLARVDLERRDALRARFKTILKP